MAAEIQVSVNFLKQLRPWFIGNLFKKKHFKIMPYMYNTLIFCLLKKLLAKKAKVTHLNFHKTFKIAYSPI